MGEKKKGSASIVVTVLAVVVIVSLIGLTASLVVYSQQSGTMQDKDKQISNLQSQLSTPKLVSVGLQYTDNRSDTNVPFLHVTGYVVNVGATKANNCTIHVTAIQNDNVTALDTTKVISTSIDAGLSQTIDIEFPYTGPALEAYTSYLAWNS